MIVFYGNDRYLAMIDYRIVTDPDRKQRYLAVLDGVSRCYRHHKPHRQDRYTSIKNDRSMQHDDTGY